MRRRLALVSLAVSAMVAVAFVVPLAVLVRTTAEDRAIDAARADAAAVVPALAAGSSTDSIEAAIAVTSSGAAGRLVVRTADGDVIGGPEGQPPPPSNAVAEALGSGSSSIRDLDGGVEVVNAVADMDGRLSAVSVVVPEAELRRGQWRAWAALAAVALILIVISVVIADRLARTIVGPTEELLVAARRLGDGDLDTRVAPDGPPEIVELGGAFNDLGERISGMLDHERELVAELSHRLRTPLTKLRMRVDQVDDPSLVASLQGDLAEVTEVVNDLIREARAGVATPVITPTCDAAEVAEDRAAYWSVLAEDQGRGWQFDRRAGHAPVPLDSATLAAALDVLIENVFAHTDEGVPMSVGVRVEQGNVWVGVGDGGPGFHASQAERGVSGGESTGLGLDIASRTATDAGGTLVIDRSDLGGAFVALVLPLATTS